MRLQDTTVSQYKNIRTSDCELLLNLNYSLKGKDYSLSDTNIPIGLMHGRLFIFDFCQKSSSQSQKTCLLEESISLRFLEIKFSYVKEVEEESNRGIIFFSERVFLSLTGFSLKELLTWKRALSNYVIFLGMPKNF